MGASAEGGEGFSWGCGSGGWGVPKTPSDLGFCVAARLADDRAGRWLYIKSMGGGCQASRLVTPVACLLSRTRDLTVGGHGGYPGRDLTR